MTSALTQELVFTDFEDEFDGPEVEYQDAPTNVSESFFGAFLGDLEALAKKTIKAYFDDKEMHCGGRIPTRLLNHPEYLTQVLNMEISDAVDRAYEAMGRSGMYNDNDESLVTEDIQIVVSLIHSIGACVPKCFIPGILLMHLELVEGVEF